MYYVNNYLQILYITGIIESYIPETTELTEVTHCECYLTQMHPNLLFYSLMPGILLQKFVKGKVLPVNWLNAFRSQNGQ